MSSGTPARSAKQTTARYAGAEQWVIPLSHRVYRYIRLLLEENAFLQTVLQSKSRRFEPPAESIGILALVHTTRLTGGYDWCSVLGGGRGIIFVK